MDADKKYGLRLILSQIRDALYNAELYREELESELRQVKAENNSLKEQVSELIDQQAKYEQR